MSRRDLDEFLTRSADVLAGPDPAPAACAWCSHPLDDASPSGDFCGERCAADWRAGLDRDPDERCACRACDPEGYEARQRAWDQRFPSRVEPRRLATLRPSHAERPAALRDLSTDLLPASLAFWEHHLRRTPD